MSKIAMQIKINSKAAKVWEVLADIGGVSKWSPAILESRSTTEANGGVGARRHCNVAALGNIDEEVVGWEEGRVLRCRFENAGPLKAVSTEYIVTPEGDDTIVDAVLDFQAKLGLDLLVRTQMPKTMKATLGALKHHVETGEMIDGTSEIPESALAAVTDA